EGRIVRYGFSERAAVRASRVREDINGSRFVLEHGDDAIEFRTSLIGRYNIAHALAATAIALEFDVDLTTAGRGLASLQDVPGRLQRVATEGEGYQVFVDYAHTDDALRNVLGATKRLTGGKLWCVFGCGGDRDRTKRPLMARAVADLADAIVVTSDNPRSEEPRDIIRGIEQGLTESDRRRTIVEPDRAAAIEIAIERLNEGDTLVIAGKGHEDYQIVGATRVHFDDFEVARDAIARRRSGKA
ncbi:MAG: Mur ligase family protein, partial [Planctomycetota bacterium]|nr:Mur ligase family protein [Planctomycetota bacterium]